jgi:hypothetical protein
MILWIVALLALAVECKKCQDTGLAPCPAAAKHACAGDVARFCSIAIACPTCAGTGRVACERCDKDPGPENAAAQEKNRAWLAETVAAIEPTMGRSLAHARSAHFLLTYDVHKVDAKGGEKLHGGLHLYLARCEELWTRFARDLAAKDEDFSAPTQVLLWERKDDQEKASLAFTRQSSATESKLMGRAPAVSIFYDKSWLHDESELHQAVVHQLVHCLLSNVWDGIWPGNIRGGWLDEGLSHAYELELFGAVRHYCYIESDTILDIQRGSWEPPVRAAVDREEAPGFLGVASKNTVELTREEQPFAWSYVDFVRRRHAAALGPLCRAIKARKPLEDALQETLGVSRMEFESRWQAFVREEYELRKRR